MAVAVAVAVGVEVAVAVGVEVAVAVGVEVAVAVAVGVEVAVAVGVGLGGAATSSAPMSGVVAERVSLSKSLGIAGIGVPTFAAGEESEERWRSAFATFRKPTTTPERLFASPADAVCQLAKVWSAARPQMPTVAGTALFRTLKFDAPAPQPVAGVVFTFPIA